MNVNKLKQKNSIVHNTYRYKAGHLRHAEVRSAKILSDILNEFEIKHWLDFGTLLGAIRDKQVIDSDVDIDISCIINPQDNLWDEQRQIYLLQELQKKFYIKYFIRDQIVSLYPRDAGLLKRFKLNHIDLYFYTSTDKTVQMGLHEKMSFRTFFIDELETIKLLGHEFTIPRHTDDFLKMRYGEDWRIPSDLNTEQNVLPNKNKYVCYTSMVADMFHIGHINLLKRCRQLFDTVIVGIHNDDDVTSYKGKPHDVYSVRCQNVLHYGLCDTLLTDVPVITTTELIDSIGADFVVAGREDLDKIKRLYPIPSNRLHLIERTPNISTTLLKGFKSV